MAGEVENFTTCENVSKFGRAEDRQGVSILRKGLERWKIAQRAKMDGILGLRKIDRGCRFSAEGWSDRKFHNVRKWLEIWACGRSTGGVDSPQRLESTESRVFLNYFDLLTCFKLHFDSSYIRICCTSHQHWCSIVRINCQLFTFVDSNLPWFSSKSIVQRQNVVVTL